MARLQRLFKDNVTEFTLWLHDSLNPIDLTEEPLVPNASGLNQPNEEASTPSIGDGSWWMAYRSSSETGSLS